MNRTEPLPLAVSLVLAVGLMGWIVWSQRPEPPPAEEVRAAPAPSPAEAPPEPDVPEPLPIDGDRAAALRAAADEAPDDLQSRVDLGNLYHEARRFEDAAPWFEAALALDPDLVEVSTDLGVAYFYQGSVDRALAQFDRSLEIDPRPCRDAAEHRHRAGGRQGGPRRRDRGVGRVAASRSRHARSVYGGRCHRTLPGAPVSCPRPGRPRRETVRAPGGSPRREAEPQEFRVSRSSRAAAGGAATARSCGGGFLAG